MKRLAAFAVVSASCAVAFLALGTTRPPDGRALFANHCASCHSETEFARAEYRIRSTHHGELPLEDDLVRTIERKPVALTDGEVRALARHLLSLSPRFATERPEAIAVPTGPASVRRGRELYRSARCFLCHGDAGRGDGAISTTLTGWNAALPARNLTRGWTFKGGHEPRDIYFRITGGMNGTPMGPYADLLTDAERWDLAHYVASLDVEPAEPTGGTIVAHFIDGDVPAAHDAPEWLRAAPVTLRGSVTVRSLWNGREMSFLLEWDDPMPSRLDFDPEDAFWKEGRWHVVVRRPASDDPFRKIPVRLRPPDTVLPWIAAMLAVLLLVAVKARA